MKLYGDIPNGHSFESPRIEIGKIIGESLNSRSAIKIVLKNLCNQADLGSEKSGSGLGLIACPTVLPLI